MHIVVKSKKLYLWGLFLAILAVLVTLNLVYIHYKPEGTQSYCDLNAYWNCDRINQSTFAEMFGVPLAVLGFVYYIFLSLNLFGVARGFNYRKYYPLPAGWLFGLSTLFALAQILYLGFSEFDLLHFSSGLQIYSVIKSVFLLLITAWCYWINRHGSESKKFLLFLTNVALIGFLFSFYLSHIELLVLEGICIFCLMQQILIFLTLIILFIAQFQHERRTT